MLVLIWFVCGLAAAVVAANKQRSAVGWLILGLLLGPIALLAAAMISPDQQRMASRQQRAGLQNGKLRRCPHCAETIQAQANVCRFCDRQSMPEQRRGLLG